ncbi:uroporphyrinogen-III synthase [Loktanella agnita]|uniref:uroporphyrinogen-III synthase n=1 Tax=Loktanella agnita TaxID=287097 RepID=UPI00398667A6
MTPTLIVTRPAPQGAAYADAVQARWAGSLEVIQSPLLHIVPVPLSPMVAQAEALILTSVNGVAVAAEAGLPAGMAAWCVGEKTGQAAQDAGFSPIVGPADAEGLIGMISAAGPAMTLVHIRGEHSRGNIAERLTDAGLRCTEVIGYKQHAKKLNAAALDALTSGAPVVFPLFSPRTAEILVENGPFTTPIDVVAISSAVEVIAVDLQPRFMVVADRPDVGGVVDATIACLNALCSRVQ